MKLIPVETRPQGIAINRTGTRAYVANYWSSTVSVIDMDTDTVLRSPITFGDQPYGLAVTPMRVAFTWPMPDLTPCP